MSKYRKSVVVNVVRPTKPLMLGDFSKIVFLTDEIDFSIKRYTTLEEVKKDFGVTSKIYEGIEVFMSQADLDGNTFGFDIEISSKEVITREMNRIESIEPIKYEEE